MKPVATLLLSTAVLAVFLMGAAATPAPAPGGSGKTPNATAKGATAEAKAKSTKDAAGAQLKLQQDAERARQGVEQLLANSARPIAPSPEIGNVLAGQSRLSGRLEDFAIIQWLLAGLLVLACLLGATGVWLSWQQRIVLLHLDERQAVLGERMRALEQAVAAAAAGQAAGQSQGAPPGIGEAGESGAARRGESSFAGEAADGGARPAPAAVMPPPPAADGVQRQPGSQAATAPAPTSAAAPAPPVATGMRHGAIVGLLAGLRQDARRLAEGFTDPALGARCRRELEAPLGARLDRLRMLAAQGEDQVRERWLGPDLITTLDALARLYSDAVEEERRGSRTGLAGELRRWLYDELGPACQGEGWFAIDPIEPYVTPFDPRVHHAVAGRDVAGAEERVVAIRAVGRRDPRTGAVAAKAEVVVGR